jgi:negative regulator of sigma E activity
MSWQLPMRMSAIGKKGDKLNSFQVLTLMVEMKLWALVTTFASATKRWNRVEAHGIL